MTVGGHESIMVQTLRLEEQQRAKDEKRLVIIYERGSFHGALMSEVFGNSVIAESTIIRIKFAVIHRRAF